jgi:hypothetical protein
MSSSKSANTYSHTHTHTQRMDDGPGDITSGTMNREREGIGTEEMYHESRDEPHRRDVDWHEEHESDNHESSRHVRSPKSPTASARTC